MTLPADHHSVSNATTAICMLNRQASRRTWAACGHLLVPTPTTETTWRCNFRSLEL